MRADSPDSKATHDRRPNRPGNNGTGRRVNAERRATGDPDDVYSNARWAVAIAFTDNLCGPDGDLEAKRLAYGAWTHGFESGIRYQQQKDLFAQLESD